MESDSIIPEVRSHITDAVSLIRSAKYLTAFTGAGISVESGIPPFRGPGGLRSKYDPRMLELDFFLAHPEKAWPVIKEFSTTISARPTPTTPTRCWRPGRRAAQVLTAAAAC